MAANAAIFYGKSAGVTQRGSVFTKNGITFLTTLYNIKIYIVLLYNVRVSMSYYQEIMKEISGLVGASTADGTLDKKTKELIMIGIAVANRCDGCIGFHTKALVDLGVTEQELAEALGVAVAMGGGPSVMYAANTLKAFKEFS